MNYVGNVEFGNNKDYDSFIEDLVKNVKNIPRYIYGKQLLSELYEEFYNIAKHTDKNRPLSSVAFNESEKYLENGIYEAYVEKFAYLDVHNKLGISFNDLLQLPKHKIEQIFRALNRYSKTKINSDENAINELEKNLNNNNK